MSDVRDVRGRYIDADKLITTIDSSDELDAYSAITVCDLIENEQPADVRENVHGEWIHTGRTNIYGGFEIECSVCHTKLMVSQSRWDIGENFCDVCGADMRKEVEE